MFIDSKNDEYDGLSRQGDIEKSKCVVQFYFLYNSQSTIKNLLHLKTSLMFQILRCKDINYSCIRRYRSLIQDKNIIYKKHFILKNNG